MDIRGAGGGGQPKQRQASITPDSARLRSNSFAQLQLLLCEGPIKGPAAGTSESDLERSVYLGDTPIRIGNKRPREPADLVLTKGTDDQTVVPGYNFIYSTTAVDQAVTVSSPASKRLDPLEPGASHKLEMILTFDGLTESDTRNGDVTGSRVAVKYRIYDVKGQEIADRDYEIRGKFSGSFQVRHEISVDKAPGPWVIVVYRMTPDDEERNQGDEGKIKKIFSSGFSFTSATVSMRQGLRYPYSALLTLAIDAETYSSIPAIEVEVFGKLIQVPSNYDPDNRRYDGKWDGTFKQEYSNNPAWVMYDLLTSDRYGVGAYFPSSAIDKWTLYEVAQYCDETIEDPSTGIRSPRFTCNCLVQNAEEAWNVLNQFASLFRGMIYYGGGVITPVLNQAKDAIFTFNESNTIQDVDDDGRITQANFVYSGVAKRAKHTVVLVSWDDPDDKYEPRVEYLADEEGLRRNGYRPLDLRLFATTNRVEALRMARWALYSEKLLDDTVTFRTNEIAMALRPGDIIKIADPTKALDRYGGRVMEVNGNVVTLDAMPPGVNNQSKFSFMAAKTEQTPDDKTTVKVPVLYECAVVSVNGDDLTVSWPAEAGSIRPQPGEPWLLETANLRAQVFRVLTIEEVGDGIWGVTALRHRNDIFDFVDKGTPLTEDDDYFFSVSLLRPDPPKITQGFIVFDNNVYKIDLRWLPPDTRFAGIEGGFDVTIDRYRTQYQAGEEANGIFTWDETWTEGPTVEDPRAIFPLDDYTPDRHFKARVMAISQIGAQSDWSDEYIITPIAGPDDLPDGETAILLKFINLPNGGHRFRWEFTESLPNFVTGIELQVQPVYSYGPLTQQEQDTLGTPNAEGWWTIGAYPLQDQPSYTFPGSRTWVIRARFLTDIPGISGTSYAQVAVDQLDILPPRPVNFRVVVERDSQSFVGAKRFSWEVNPQPDRVQNWPGGKVTDITEYRIRYRQGQIPDWDRAYDLFSDGITGTQTWFETKLFDSGEWCIMIKSVDRTGWESPQYSAVTVNIGDPIPTNVVERQDLRDQFWPGTWENMTEETVSAPLTLMYPTPLSDPFYTQPYTDNIYEIVAGSTALRQADPSKMAVYTGIYSVTSDNTQLQIYTVCTGTYRWFVRRGAGGQEQIYDPPAKGMYDPPGELLYFNADKVADRDWLPYAPNMLVAAGLWQFKCEIISLDGTTRAELADVDLIYDMPDVFQAYNDYRVPVGGGRINFPPGLFREVKAVNITVQDDPGQPGRAISAAYANRSSTGVTVYTYDATGAYTAGLVDLVVAGY